jgi:RimJ/RimL family protein N-acetyltransferase
MESFTTQRLSAEKLREAHLADLVALHLDPDVMRYVGGVRSPETTREYLAANLAHWDRHGFGLWVLRMRSGAFAGRAGIRHLMVGGAPEVDVAYTFKRAFWGQGLASEIAAALTKLGLEQLGFASLVGVAAIENAGSRRVLEKSGFALERRTIYREEDVALYRRMRSAEPPPGGRRDQPKGFG